MAYTQVFDPAAGQVNAKIVQRDADGAFIPTDPDNVDYQEYLAWCDEGNTAKAYTPPPPPATQRPARSR